MADGWLDSESGVGLLTSSTLALLCGGLWYHGLMAGWTLGLEWGC